MSAFAAALAVVVASMVAAGPALAASKSAVLVIDANTGRVLHESAADEQRHPASLAKMMTIYLAFEMIEQGRLNYQTKIKMSANAAAQAPTKLDLEEGEEIALVDAIKVLITKSANDIAVAIAEHIAGSEERFAKLMTQKARQLGMSATLFKNASGLPDDEQVTTARDMVTLALRLQDDFPQHYPLFATRTFTHKDETLRNHNTLLFSYEGTDGIKTGYTRASGFNLVASVRRGRKHVIGAVFGGASASSRNAAMRTFLNMGLIKASSEKTRQPATPLIAKARPGAERQVASVAAVPTPQRVARPLQPTAAPQALAAEAAAALQPTATPSAAAPPIEMARVRTVPVTPRSAEPAAPGAPTRAPDPIQAQTILAAADAALEQRTGPGAGPGTAPSMPSWATASATGAPVHSLAAPTDRPAMFTDPALALGAALSSLDAQAANLARGEPPVTAPAPRLARAVALPQPVPVPKRSTTTGATGALPGALQIQIGAFQSQAEAERKLATARAQAPAQLANRPAVTSQVKQGDKLFFRARFSGFEAQAAANACSELKRLKVDCLVVKGE